MNAKFEHFLVDVENGICVLTINHPKELNAMSTGAWGERHQFMLLAEKDASIQAIIITGAGEKAFVAGAEIGELQPMSGLESLALIGNSSIRLIEKSMKPVIAAVNGYAFGGGCELAVACDIRIVSENALFGLPETSLGIMPDLGGTQRITRLLGVGRAKEMILAGRNIGGAEAAQSGLAMKCVPLADLLDEAKKVARDILKRGPLATAVAKKVISVSAHTDIDTGLMMEMFAFAFLMDSKDKSEGIQAFIDKRKPEFTGE